MILPHYEKYDPIGYNSGDSWNGIYIRQLMTKFGEITVEVPRDRKGDFKQQTIPVYKRNDDSLETTVIQLYQKGVTTSEIAELIEKMYGHYYTPATISNLTKQVEQQVNEFHSRPLQNRYVVIYGDATYLNVRRDSVAKEALHVLVGIDEYGHKEVLDYRLYKSEFLNKKLKHDIERKEQFPNEDSLDHFTCMKVLDYNQRFSDMVHKGFGLVIAELINLFD